MKAQAGGWWNLATGSRPEHFSKKADATGNAEGINVEAKISELASAFDIPPATLATAIASAVSAHAPPATLSSIRENEAPTASLVKTVVQDSATEAEDRTKGFMSNLNNVVGFDDAGEELD